MVNKIALVTGITGQDGAYLSELLLSKGYTVVGIYRNSLNPDFSRLDYLGIKNRIELIPCDLNILKECKSVIAKYLPDEVYNLAAQSSVSNSFDYPIETISFNILSVINLLEAIKIENRYSKFYQAASSEMFGKIHELPITDNSFPHPLSPYAISKITGFWTANNYKESYNMFVSCGILFNHESYLRPHSFFIKKAISTAIKIKYGELAYLEVGNIDIKRDFGYAKEYVKAIWLMLQVETPDNFQVCSGVSISLREILYFIFDYLNVDRQKIVQSNKLFRPTEINDIFGNNHRTKEVLGWEYDMTFFKVLELLINEELENFQINL